MATAVLQVSGKTISQVTSFTSRNLNREGKKIVLSNGKEVDWPDDQFTIVLECETKPPEGEAELIISEGNMQQVEQVDIKSVSDEYGVWTAFGSHDHAEVRFKKKP